MKLNFKKWIAALACFASLGAAQAVELQFSTEAEPVWYSIKFNNGGWALADKGTNQNIQTAAAADVDAQKWQLIGNADEFKLRSKSGNYVKWGGSLFTAGAEATNLYVVKVGTNYEIGRVGSDSHFNMWQGAGANHNIGEYNSGDSGNGLHFYDASGAEATLPVVIPVGELPKFSTDTEEYWYFINHVRGTLGVKAAGTGNSAVQSKMTPTADMQWKLVGTQENLQLISKTGEYLTVEGTATAKGSVKTSTTPYSGGWSLIPTSNETYFKNWEILSNSENKCLNPHGGNNVDGQFCLWTAGDAGNPVAFRTIDQVTFGEFEHQPSTTYQPENKLTLWYTIPGTKSTSGQQWMDAALPIGNGELGCQILGGVSQEDISFTEKTLWSGSKDMHGGSNYKGYGSFELFGNLYISVVNPEMKGYTADSAIKDYWRNLDMTTGIAGAHYVGLDGTTEYDREFLSSNPDGVIAMNFTASAPGALSLNFQVRPGMSLDHPVTYADGEATFSGKLETVSYTSILKVIPTGGTVTSDENGITVTGADGIFVILAADTDYDPITPSYTSGTETLIADQQAKVAAAAAKGWDAIKADHIANHQSYFNRLELSLGESVNNLPTDQLKNAYKNGTATAAQQRMLEEIYFHLGRYMAIGSNRDRALPNNLQGIWTGFSRYNFYSNGYAIQPWNADIHANINIQMNYWPVEPANLSELHMPLCDYIINQATVQPQWRYNATQRSGAQHGWTTYTENGIFGNSSGWFNQYTEANAWYCTHLWTHYRYTMDRDFLQRAFTTMWTACEFWFDHLIVDKDGSYVSPQEYSPEHGPGAEDGTAHAQQIVTELFANTLSAIEVLGSDCGLSEAEINTLKDYYEKIDKGLRTEEFTAASGWTANGLSKGDLLLREWKYSDYTVGQNGHRHLSHLMCLYPFNQVKPGTKLFQAAVNSLRQRGDAATGWSLGWKVNCWARALDGDHTYTIISNALKNNTYTNLYDSHPPFQIDGNFGVTSGICEMLSQGQNDELYLLPALPKAWPDGSVKGLKAVGNFTVDIDWKDGKMSQATVTSNAGTELRLRANDLLNCHVTVDGQDYEPTVDLYGIVAAIPTEKGSVVKIVYDPEYTNPNTIDTTPEPIKVSAINLSETEVTLEVGKTVTITATVEPEDAEETDVTWSSEDTTIATVTQKGKIKGIKAGETNVLATCGEVVAPVKVTVMGPEDGIAEVKVDGISVDGNTISVSGATSLEVFDIAGRTIARAAGESVKVPATAIIVLVKATAASGATTTFKVVI